LAEYLQGNWFEAERICRELLADEPRDAEAGLLLASVLRCSSRLSEAREALDRLAQSTPADRWSREIAVERERIAARPAQDASPPTCSRTSTSICGRSAWKSRSLFRVAPTW